MFIGMDSLNSSSTTSSDEDEIIDVQTILRDLIAPFPNSFQEFAERLEFFASFLNFNDQSIDNDFSKIYQKFENLLSSIGLLSVTNDTSDHKLMTLVYILSSVKFHSNITPGILVFFAMSFKYHHLS